MVLEKLDAYMQKNEMGPISITLHQTNSKSTKDLTVTPKILKAPEDNISSILQNIGVENIFMNRLHLPRIPVKSYQVRRHKTEKLLHS